MCSYGHQGKEAKWTIYVFALAHTRLFLFPVNPVHMHIKLSEDPITT